MAKLKDLTPKPKTRVAFLIDRSGSMHGMQKFVVDTYNEQLQQMRKKKDEQDISVTTVWFDGDVEFLTFNTDIAEAKDISTEDYKPNGTTALNDAIGLTIDKFKKLEDWDNNDVAYLFVIITDGAENASKEYKTQIISNFIEELEAKGNWTFTYFGEGVNIKQIQKNYSFAAGNMMTGSIEATAQTRTMALDSYFISRGSGKTQLKSFYKG